MLTIWRLTVIIFAINISLISYTVYVFYFKFNDNSNSSDIKLGTNTRQEWTEEDVNDGNDWKSNQLSYNRSDVLSVEIWSKASIGLYLWQHIMGASLEMMTDGNAYVSGTAKVDTFRLKFRSGPLLTVDSLQHMSAHNLILVLNGRDKSKIEFSQQWLAGLDQFKHDIKNIGLIVLGDEQCRNSWLRPYLQSNGGFVKFLFIVYDWKLIDNKVIYQWPLGVATYRHFPTPEAVKVNLETSRPYVCNLVATIYAHSSRLELLNILKDKYKDICIIKVRFEWLPKETTDSLNYYIESLRLSDLTLSPMGMNHECYRMFEAMAFGSVPVVEESVDHLKKTSCDSKSAFRLMKEYKAPFIYVSNWTRDLPLIIKNEQTMSLEYKIQRRLNIIKWYSKFKTLFKNQFLKVINEKFV